MLLNLDVPFFANKSDDTHCFQAALKMVLKYVWPEDDFSWEELEEITAKKKDLWTWPYAAYLWLSDQGFEIVNIDAFDSETFIKQGEGYLSEAFGKEVAEAQIANSDIEQERKLADECLRKFDLHVRIPNQEDIMKLLSENYLIICTVNSAVLNDKPGYAGHSIVVKGLTDHGFIIHDPGLPPQENRDVSFDLFEKAWAYPNEKAKNILAIKWEE